MPRVAVIDQPRYRKSHLPLIRAELCTAEHNVVAVIGPYHSRHCALHRPTIAHTANGFYSTRIAASSPMFCKYLIGYLLSLRSEFFVFLNIFRSSQIRSRCYNCWMRISDLLILQFGVVFPTVIIACLLWHAFR